MRLRKAQPKRVLCTHCGKPNEVGAHAMSVFCSHCRQRLILEDYSIKSYQGVKGYATCGNVVVEKSGRVNAGIQAGNLTIKGHVKGDVLARGTVHVTRTGVLTGKVVAHALDVLPGASINAVCRIGPPPPEPETTPSPPPPPRGTDGKRAAGARVKAPPRSRSVSKTSKTTTGSDLPEVADLTPAHKTVDAPAGQTPTAKATGPKKSAPRKPTAKTVRKGPAGVKSAKSPKPSTGAGKRVAGVSKPPGGAAKPRGTAKTASAGKTTEQQKSDEKKPAAPAKKSTRKTIKKITTRRTRRDP